MHHASLTALATSLLFLQPALCAPTESSAPTTTTGSAGGAAETASEWSFTMWDAPDCGSAGGATPVSGKGDSTCNEVPNAGQQQSMLGYIAADSTCRINFYPSEGCGDRIAWGLTNYTTGMCQSLDGLEGALRYYQTFECQ